MAKKLEYGITFFGVDRVSRIIRRMEGRTGRFLSRIAKKTRAIRQANRMVTSGLRRVVIGFTAVAAAGILAFGSLGAAGGEFESSIVSAMAKLRQFNRTTERGQRMYSELSAKAREMGITTEFTSNQAAQGLDTLAMAGFNMEQSMKALPGVLNIATISGAGLAEATDIATGTLGAFNLMVDDAVLRQKNLTRVNDVMANTLTSSKVAIVDFNDAVRDGGAIAAQAGTSIEQYGALLAGLASANLRGSKAGMALKNMYMRLSDPKIARDLKNRLGVNVADDKGDWRDMITILGELKEATKGMGTHELTAFMNAVFAKRAAPATIKLMQIGTEKLRAFEEANRRAHGMSTKMSKAIRDTFKVEWLNFIAVIDETKIAMFEYTKGPMRDVLVGTKAWMMGNRELFTSLAKGMAMILRYPKVILWIVSLAGVLAGTLTILSLALGALALVGWAMAAGGVAVFVLWLGALGVVLGGLIVTVAIFKEEIAGGLVAAMNKAIEVYKRFDAWRRGKKYVSPADRARDIAHLVENINIKRHADRYQAIIREAPGLARLIPNPDPSGTVITKEQIERETEEGHRQDQRIMRGDFSGREETTMRITIENSTDSRVEVPEHPKNTAFNYIMKSIAGTVGESGAFQ